MHVLAEMYPFLCPLSLHHSIHQGSRSAAGHAVKQQLPDIDLVRSEACLKDLSHPRIRTRDTETLSDLMFLFFFFKGWNTVVQYY